MVHGAAGCTDFGRTKNLWSPAAAGRAFDLTPTSMISLEPYRDYLTIISDTDVHFGEAITPNLHKLARQFGVLDNFYDSGEVSGDGHIWTTAAIARADTIWPTGHAPWGVPDVSQS